MRRYSEVKEGKYIYSCKDPANFPREFNRQRDRLKKISTIFDYVTKEFPDLSGVVNTLKTIHSMGRVDSSETMGAETSAAPPVEAWKHIYLLDQ